MNNHTTYILAAITGVVLLMTGIVGVLSSQTPAAPTVQPQTSPQPTKEQSLTVAELSTLLEAELPAITSVFNQAFPTASEQYTIDLLFSLITSKFPNFAVLKTSVQTNPVHYFLG